MPTIAHEIDRFFEDVAKGDVEIYNEFSLQHELGFFRRSRRTRPRVKIQFERPVGYFGLIKRDYIKTEIDLTAFESRHSDRCAIEVKFPRNGQYPEQMFKIWQDVAFIEQLVDGGFRGGYFVVAADDSLFWSGREQTGVYAPFRTSSPIHGRISKPTGKNKDETVEVRGTYPVAWRQAGSLRYVSLVVGEDCEI